MLESVSAPLFGGVVASYGEAVINSVREAAKENMDDVLTLLNICLPELQTVLARQRRDYGLSEDLPAEYPVFQLAKNIDDTLKKELQFAREISTTLPSVDQ